MKKVCHSNILSIQEVVWADDGDCVDAYLVMDLFNFDLRKLLDKIGIRFSTAEIKHLFNQIVKGVAYLHQNSLLHRDLKTENSMPISQIFLTFSVLVDLHGNLKICDFGLSRQFTTKNAYTPVVVTLWYRPPELLLGPVEYSTEIDQWSVGCIFAELLRGVVLFNGNNEVEQVDKIFQVTGTPSEDTWPGFSSLPQHKTARIKSYPNRLLSYFEKCCISSNGFDLLSKLLALCPSRRISAEYVLQHNYFKEEPAAVTCIDMFAKSDYIRYQYCQEQASQHPAYNKHQQQHHNSHMQSHQPPPPSYTQYPQQSHYLQRQQQLIHHARQKQQQYPLHHQQLSFPTYSFLKNPPAIECHGGTYPVPSPHPHPPQPNQLQLHPDNRT